MPKNDKKERGLSQLLLQRTCHLVSDTYFQYFKSESTSLFFFFLHEYLEFEFELRLERNLVRILTCRSLHFWSRYKYSLLVIYILSLHTSLHQIHFPRSYKS